MIFRRVLQVLLGAILLLMPRILYAQSGANPPQVNPGLIARSVDNQQKTNEPVEQVVIAQPKANIASHAFDGIVVGAIRVEGADDLPSAEVMTAIAPYIGHTLSARDLQNLLAMVSGIARAHGYIFASSEIPPQTITAGVLTIRMDLGRIDRIEVNGPAKRQVLRMLKPLEGKIAKRADIAHRLGLAADVPGVAIGRIGYANVGGTKILTVPTSFGRYSGFVEVDNRGLKGLGPERIRLVLTANSALTTGDSLVIEGLATPVHPNELGVLAVRYSLQPSSSGTRLAVYGSEGKTRPGGPYEALGLTGESQTAGIGVTQPLIRTENAGVWASATVERTLVREWDHGKLIRRDALTTANVTLNGYAPLAKGRLQAGATVTKGLSLLDATQSGDPLAPRLDISPDFTKASMWAQWEGPIAGPISTRISSVGQISSGPLPTVQQLTIGGPNFGRAYDWNERIGDEGALVSVEVRANLVDRPSKPLKSLQLYTYADGGTVSARGSDYGTGSLFSAGGGVRIELSSQIRLEVEAAFPIDANRLATEDKTPRLSFSVSKIF